MQKYFYFLLICIAMMQTGNAVAQTQKQAKEIEFIQGSLQDFEKAVLEKKKPGFVYLYSNGQRDCMAMNRMLQEKEMVQFVDSNFIAYKVDVEENPFIALQYGVESLPAVILVNASYAERERLYGYRISKDFRKFLSQVLQ